MARGRVTLGVDLNGVRLPTPVLGASGTFGSGRELSELVDLTSNLARLDSAERARHLTLLNTPTLAALRRRLSPVISTSRGRVRVERASLDGKHHLTLVLEAPDPGTQLLVAGQTVRVRPRARGPVRLRLRISTDAPALAPLPRDSIFNAAFLSYADSVARLGGVEARRLERRMRGVELLTSREKLTAGLPNFATYFGRDMLVTALLMEPIWAPGMLEHVLGSALAKLSPDGAVSHEEALGGQAIRESAAEYSQAIAAALTPGASPGSRDSALAQARAILSTLDATRENYRMVDDDFQLPVVAARYLANPAVPDESKRAFLLAQVRAGEPATAFWWWTTIGTCGARHGGGPGRSPTPRGSRRPLPTRR